MGELPRQAQLTQKLKAKKSSTLQFLAKFKRDAFARGHPVLIYNDALAAIFAFRQLYPRVKVFTTFYPFSEFVDSFGESLN